MKILNQKGMKCYMAPDGYVFDYKEPHIATILELDGSTSKKEEHLYVKYLSLGKFDNIDNYITVKDPKLQKEV